MQCLDRHFRLLREDLIDTVKTEFGEEIKRASEKRRKIFPSATLMGVGLHPQPQFLIQVHLTRRLQVSNAYVLPGHPILGVAIRSRHPIFCCEKSMHACICARSRAHTRAHLTISRDVMFVWIVRTRLQTAPSARVQTRVNQTLKLVTVPFTARQTLCALDMFTDVPSAPSLLGANLQNEI